MTQPIVALLDNSEDLMPLPSRVSDSGPDLPSSDTWELLADARDHCEAAMDDRDNRARNIEEARKLIEKAAELWHAEEMRRTRGRA